MVIANSDSCNTLVSLDDGSPKQQQQQEHGLQLLNSSILCDDEPSFVRTDLLVPTVYDDDDDEVDSFCVAPKQQQHIFLPADGSPVDQSLRYVENLMDRADQVTLEKPRMFSSKSQQRVLYVAQGEVAHATPSQCDVILSDRATTCHILVLRSSSANRSQPLVTLTHIDSTSYGECIRGCIREHKAYHEGNEEKKSDMLSFDDDLIDMDVHVLGGYGDSTEARDISNHLMHLLGSISVEERNSICMTLATCVVSSMNGSCAPVGRGLGMNMSTGHVFLAGYEGDPTASALRSARLWQERTALSLVHTHTCDYVVVEPFSYKAQPTFGLLLKLDDATLLQYTSTSPDVEDAKDFCHGVRASLKLIQTVPCNKIFTNGRPIIFERKSLNQWRLVQTNSDAR
mmetsp:Transcript_6539/g.9530  ORF Transcript_6539/g.9530 Transcript_6539/m.9530 type:complete len:399 (-) Transcript_6539:241-1437(-)|eukprot:CAMPEP_0194048788 /NCGR_PEP_ID=MMETSP0009_2-20130614/28543_1 /TAXON_ID=210454 /ORGANISM="Grammatophora oceanica, Strain CCMP 410" /LENGTH=398 /DNA_ID=CAMNT_0038694765 /DNA_START=27 /DNA_END=1223 /DNA_ORIENTATION=-